MSTAAFLRSIIGCDKDDKISAHAVECLVKRFNSWEDGAGGKLSFDAYSTYHMMLRCGDSDSQRLFFMFDVNRNSKLSRGEFLHLIKSLCMYADKSASASGDSGYCTKNLSMGKEVSFDQWCTDLKALKLDVWHATFSHFAHKSGQTDRVTPQEFLELVLTTVGVTGTAASNRIARTFGPSAAGAAKLDIQSGYDVSTWIAFQNFVANRARIVRLMDMSRSLFPLSPEQFNLLALACDVRMSRHDSDLIFAVFDSTHHRELEYGHIASLLNACRRHNE